MQLLQVMHHLLSLSEVGVSVEANSTNEAEVGILFKFPLFVFISTF